MKRIVFGGMFIVSLLLLQLAPAPLADQKSPGPWKTVDDVKLLKVWEDSKFGLQWPQITLLQLSREQLKELQNDQLEFYKKYGVFGPRGTVVCDNAVAQLQVSLVNPSIKSKDAVLVVAGHDWTTNCSFSALAVTKIEPY